MLDGAKGWSFTRAGSVSAGSCWRSSCTGSAFANSSPAFDESAQMHAAKDWKVTEADDDDGDEGEDDGWLHGQM